MALKASSNPPFNDSDTALRGSAYLQYQAKPQVVSAAKENMAGFVLANGPAATGSSNQSGEAIRQPPDRALIEADLVDTALRDSAFPQREATPQVLSKAKNNMVALSGQLFYSTQIPVCLWFIERSGNASAKRSAFKTSQIQYNDAMGKAHSNFQLTR